jgi:nucleotide-binding universal stress UspA family protein
MYRTILVPLDGSPFAEHALPLALSLARRATAVLHLVRVHIPIVPLYSGSELLVDASLDARIRDQEHGYLEAIIERIKGTTPVRALATIQDGPIADALVKQAVLGEADLMVMTTHGRGPFSRFWLGSVADRLVRLAPMPVLLVRPHDGAADLTQEVLPRHILIPLDGSALAEQILEPAIELGRLIQAEYMLLGVVEASQVPDYAIAGNLVEDNGGGVIWPQQAKLQTYLDEVAERLRRRSLPVQTRVILHQPAAAAILDAAHLHADGVIALATHGRSGLDRMLLGSVADKVIRGATTPVLVQRAPNS